MPRLSITFRDDIGREVPVFNIVAARNGDGAEGDPSLAKLAGTIADDLDDRIGFQTNLNGGHFWLLGLSTLGWVALGWMRSAWPVLSGWWSGILLAPFFALGAFMQSRWIRVHRGERIAAALLRAGRCGSCAFALRGLRENEGRLRCPECGACWDQSRVTREPSDPSVIATKV